MTKKKQNLVGGKINRKGVGYVESTADAYIMLEWARARARALSSKNKELRVVISEEIKPWEAPEIVLVLRISGYDARSADQIFTKAVANSRYENLSIAVLNPRVLFFKEKALKKLKGRYSSISEVQHNIKSTLLIRAALTPPPLCVPQRITPEDLRIHYAFLLEPAFLDANLPVLKPAAAIAEGIVQLRTSLGLPAAGGQAAISNLLRKLRAELAIMNRRLVTLELDKKLLLQEVEIEQTAIKALDLMLPGITQRMESKSLYGSEGFRSDQEGLPRGEAPPGGLGAWGASAGAPAGEGEAPPGGLGAGDASAGAPAGDGPGAASAPAPAPNVASA